MDAHEVLCRARNLIDQNGWIQHTAGSPTVGFCVVGAVRFAASGSSTGEAKSGIGPLFRRCIGEHSEVEWNNASDRTKEEVLAAFDKAIAATAPPPEDPFTSTDNLPEFLQKETV